MKKDTLLCIVFAFCITATMAAGNLNLSQDPSIVITAHVTNVTCPGYSNGSISVEVSGGTPDYTYSWSTGATTDNITGLTAGDYTVSVTDAASNFNTQTITVSEPPALVAGPIAGTSSLCASGAQTVYYAISSVPSASSYLWSAPPGMNITAGQGTNFITISMTGAAIASGIKGNVCVIAGNGCGSSAPSCMAVDINAVAPVQPSSISGPGKACPDDTLIYSVGNVSRASQYQWTLPTGASIVSGAGTNIIKVAYDAGFTPGTITVRACNSCGCSPARSRAVNLNPISTPGSISGQLNGVCNSTLSYTSSVVPSAKGYTWSLTGSGASFNGSNIGSSVSVNYTNTFNSGTLAVAAFNGCGVSSQRTANIKGAPAMPGPITGTTNPCINTTYPYSVNTVQGTLTYNWTSPGTISGQGSKNITVTYGTIPVVNQTITVTATNDCGTSSMRSLGGITVGLCTRTSTAVNPSDLEVYPVPAHDKLYVKWNSEEGKSYMLQLTDITGRVVFSEKMKTENSELKELNLHSLSPGSYLLTLSAKDYTAQANVVIE